MQTKKLQNSECMILVQNVPSAFKCIQINCRLLKILMNMKIVHVTVKSLKSSPLKTILPQFCIRKLTKNDNISSKLNMKLRFFFHLQWNYTNVYTVLDVALTYMYIQLKSQQERQLWISSSNCNVPGVCRQARAQFTRVLLNG